MQIIYAPPKKIIYISEIRPILEEKLGIKLILHEDYIEIKSQDASNEYLCVDVIKAITYGYDYKKAVKLISPEYDMKVINLKDFISNEKTLHRQIGRLIGLKGAVKRNIERDADVSIIIKDYKIIILGLRPDVDVAVQGLLKLISGAKHSTVYRYIIERKRSEYSRDYG
ncbi:hypothetical protein J7J26_02300 [Candidatus Micrarchaeota archaeon]|nr:hypothetical protein [Candidatus Micrarchaeota archaeon]